jgi:hypothetical protein
MTVLAAVILAMTTSMEMKKIEERVSLMPPWE